jgi:hypothetical protein
MDPWRVSDPEGRVLPMWLGSHKVYDVKGRVATRKPEAQMTPRYGAAVIGDSNAHTFAPLF